MCIIVYKPKNKKMPDMDILESCFFSNPDGAGFMCSYKGHVHIVKGLMNFTQFYNALEDAKKRYGENIPYVLHFRITTQAGKRPDCTHPYVLSDKMKDLRQLASISGMGIAHNGIISLTSEYKKDITYNDTMKFITDYLSLIIDSKYYYKDKKKIKLIEKLSNSKLAILDGGGHCELVGHGWIEDNGIFYSNSSYIPLDYGYYDYHDYLADLDDSYFLSDDFYFYDNKGVKNEKK